MKLSPLARLRGLALAIVGSCALLSGLESQAQPFVSGGYPDGTLLFQVTNSFYVTLTSGGLTNFSISLTASNLYGTGTSNVLTAGHGMTVTTNQSAYTATFALSSNYFYKAAITAGDAGGVLTQTIIFDTITPVLIWEAEDWDYQGGKFIENVTNGYTGLYGMQGVDSYNPNGGNAAYRPVNDGVDTNTDLGNETCGDTARPGWVDGGFADYDNGWNNGGSGVWANYTRHYPAGKWNIYGRMAGDGSSAKSAFMYQGGTNGTLLGEFDVPNEANWQLYNYVPLSDSVGNPIEWDTDGTAKALTIQVQGGSYNANFYFLMPVNTNFQPKPFLSSIKPDPTTNLFVSTNVFSFIANSTVGLQTSNIVVTVNGVTPNGLTMSGSSHSTLVSFPLQSNVVYNLLITLSDSVGTTVYAATLGTFTTNDYTWEAEDFDYNSGQFFDNPQVDKYGGLAGVAGVDANNTSTGNGTSYRVSPNSDGGDLSVEVTGDPKRAQYAKLGTNDYDVGWTGAGEWANYTRHYPQGVYNVYIRGSSPNGQNDSVTLSWVTNGVGTGTQGLSKIGQFNVPLTGGWQVYSWAPCVDANGNPVTITNSSSSPTTIRMDEDNGGFNANFFMLVPPDANRPTISGLYPNGQAQFQRTNTLAFTVNSLQALYHSNIVVMINGVAQNNLVFGGTPNATTVSWPNVQNNTDYSVNIIIQTPSNDSATTSFSFDTFSSTYYTWEAEDFDYSGGSFLDNPQVDKYFGVAGTPLIDCNNNSTGNGAAYRASDAGDLSTEVTGDAPRSQFAGTNDYDVGWTAAGNWANYTRHFPAGAYNVYFRIANPSALANSDTFWQVTAGVGTATQTTNLLGHINCPATGGYQVWQHTPLLDSGGNLAVINMTGGEMTFQIVQAGGSPNMNYFMLVPVTTAPTGPVLSATLSTDKAHLVISWTPTGNTLYSSPTIGAGSTWTVVGTANPATVPISGAAQFFYVGK